MKASRIVVLGVALAAGGIAAILVGSRHESAPAPAPPPLATVDVLVAKTDLSRGQVIGDGDIGWQIWPADAANPTFIRKSERPEAINEFTGAIVRMSITSGQPLWDPAVVFTKGSGFMAAILPKGMRAVAMDVSAESGAGGFILPDDHVDVLLTRRDKASEKVTGVEKYVTESILRNVRVLAIDQSVEEKNGQKVVVGHTATLEVTPDQAETLALSRQLGSLSLALRSLVDSPSSTPEGDGDEVNDRRGSLNTVRYGVTTQSFLPR